MLTVVAVRKFCEESTGYVRRQTEEKRGCGVEVSEFVGIADCR